MHKKILTLYLAFLCSVTTMAQYYKVSQEIVDKLKATTTVFFYSEQQASEIELIKQAVTDGWKLTPVIFEDISSYGKYSSDSNYSFFIIEGVTTQTSTYSNTHYYIQLRVFDKVDKKGNARTAGLCRIELYPNTESLFMSRGKADQVINKLYTQGGFYNWSPILLKAQLESVQDNLEHNVLPNHYNEFKDKDLTNILSGDTLYVPQRLLMSFNAFTAKENEKDEKIFEGYRYKYRICTDDELFDIFQTSKRGRLLFEYVKSSTDKFITIYDLKQKKAIYRNYVALSYNLKSKDIKNIK